MRNNSCPHEAGLAKLTHPAKLLLLCLIRMSTTSCRAVYLERGFFFCSAMVVVYGLPVRPYGQCQHPLRWPIRAAMMSPCTSQQALALAGFPTRPRALFPRHSCREIPADDVTRAPSLHGFLCRPARAHRPGNPLRTFREQNTRYTARDALHTRPRGNPRVPNSSNTRRHFSCPRGLVESHTERFHAGFPARRRAREGRSLNAEQAPYATSRETGAVPEITSYGAKGSPHPSPV